jgi:hypothetical protein
LEPLLKSFIQYAMSNDLSDKKTASEDVEADSAKMQHDEPKAVFAEEHAHLSLGDVLRGTAGHETNAFERKAALINE